MAHIGIRDVFKSYGAVQVIHGVNLDIEDGDFAVIIGPSGCGKSTLLRMIAGLEAITDGSIEIGGRIVNDIDPKDRDIAMVFQNYALYPHMTVRQNISFGLKLRKLPNNEVEARMNKVAHTLQLQDLLDRQPSDLSGGQRQRVAMGRAIVRDPKAFLFDEPLSNLDAKLRVQMRLEIKQLHKELSATSVYVTHDQVEAMTMADKLIVMNEGMVEQIGRPIDIYNAPATIFVASFIGSPAMNFLDVVVDENRTVRIKGKSGTCVTTQSSLPPGNIVCGIRPEKIKICEPSDALLSLHVIAIEPLGAETLIYGTYESAQLTIRRPENFDIEPGETVSIKFYDGDLHFFDPTSSQRIG